MRYRSQTQKLIDIVFQTTIMAATHEYFRGKSIQEVAEWTAGQLRDCGFPTVPCGMSWGVLVDESDKERVDLKDVQIQIVLANRPE
jgi:hypothetical protein